MSAVALGVGTCTETTQMMLISKHEAQEYRILDQENFKKHSDVVTLGTFTYVYG